MLSGILSKECINLNLKSTTKEEVIDELIEMLENTKKLNDKKKFRDEVFKLEKERSTGLEEGIAIPHARTDAVKTPVIAFGLSKKGIDYNSADGKLSNLFFMVATPEDAHDLHIEVLSTITFRLLDKRVRKKLLKAYYPEDVIKNLFDSEELKEYREIQKNSEEKKVIKYDEVKTEAGNMNENISEVLIFKNDLDKINENGFLKTFLLSKRGIFYFVVLIVLFFLTINYI